MVRKCVLRKGSVVHLLMELYGPVVHLLMELHGPNESFGFARQILDGVAPPPMETVVSVLPSEAQYDLDHVACFFLAVVVRMPRVVSCWRTEQRTLQGAGVNEIPRIAVPRARAVVDPTSPLALPATDRAVPGPFFPHGRLILHELVEIFVDSASNLRRRVFLLEQTSL